MRYLSRWLSSTTPVARLILFALTATVYAATASYTRISVDVAAAEVPAWALANYGTLDLTGLPYPDYKWLHDTGAAIRSDRFPGAIFFLVPGYWIAGQAGLTAFSFIPGAITAAIVTAGGIVAIDSALSQSFSPPVARISSILIAFGSGAWSICANAPWSHTLNFLFIAVALWGASRQLIWLVGFALGLSVTARPTMAVGVLVLAVALSRYEKSWKKGLQIGLAAAPGVLLLFSYNYVLFGRFGPSNGLELGGEIRLQLSELPGNIVGTILAPHRSLLVFYPILLVVGVVGRSAWRCASSWQRALAWAGVAVLLTQLSLNRYYGGDTFFGPRLAIEPLSLTIPFVVLCGSIAASRLSALPIKAVFIVSVLLHGAGAILTPY